MSASVAPAPAGLSFAPPRVIGIMGDAGCGKDTIADYLVWKFDYVKYSMADPLRKGLCAMIDEIDMDMLLDREAKERVIEAYGKSPRQMMQTIGTEWGRELVHSDIWLMQARRFIEKSDKPVVIPDIRFPNEHEMLQDLDGAKVWRIIRTKTPVISSHQSEGQLEEVRTDHVFHNNGTVIQLLQAVDGTIWADHYQAAPGSVVFYDANSQDPQLS